MVTAKFWQGNNDHSKNLAGKLWSQQKYETKFRESEFLKLKILPNGIFTIQNRWSDN